MKKYITKQSSIKGAGKGLFTNAFFKKDEVIGLAHVDDQPASEIGRNHNHNEKNPTAYSKKINNKRFIYASRNLKPGEEITTNYRMQPELEQPEDFMRKGGALLTKKVTCKKCGWKWDAEDGGNDITTCHKCGGQGLIHAQKGGESKCLNGQVWSKKDKKCIDLPVFSNSLNSRTFTKSTNLSDGFKIKPLNSFSDFGKIKPKKIPVIKDNFLETLEKDINDFLDNPKAKAAQLSESLADKDEVASDALRHSTAGALAAQTIANKTGNIPFISNPLGYLGANIAGIGHELSTLSQAYLDDRPWSVKLQESLEDIYNNSVGANTIFNNNSEKDKINYLLKLTRTNQLPDGYGEERPFRHNPKWTDPYNQKQYGGNTDAMNGMMKARLAYANEFGNPAAERMINLPDNPYQFDNGDTGTHYMASMDNYAVPQIQDENGVLVLGDYGPESNEAIRFDSDEDANYFAENYKDVSPGFIEAELNEDEIEEYRRGGYIVEEIDTFQKGGTVYTVKGSKGYYKKVNGKWQVDWNKSGKYQPLSKGDVKARTAVLDKMAKPAYDKDYDEMVAYKNLSTKDKINKFEPKKEATKEELKKISERLGRNYKPVDTKLQSVNMVYPEKYLIGPGGGAIGIARNAAGLGIKGLSKAMSYIPAPVSGALNAYFGIEGTKEFLNPDSHTRKSMSRAYDDPTGSNIVDAAWDVGMNSLNFLGLPFGKAIKGSKNVIKGFKQVPKQLPGSPNAVDNVQKAGFLNPLALIDRVTPRPPMIGTTFPTGVLWDDPVNYSPFNLIPGYGRKLAEPGFTKGMNSTNTEITAYRKFGNSLDDLINSKSFKPEGGFRMGANQIKNEGNWAEPGIANEHYKGVFAAGMNPRVEGTNIQLQHWPKRYGVVGMTKQGNPAIPITDPGLSFHRRLPFSNRYVPIDKQKLIDNKFQLATQLPHVQSLIEKYGIAAAYALTFGYLANGKEGAIENLKTVNKYSIDPIKNWSKTAWDELENTLNEKQKGGTTNNYIELDLTPEEIQKYKDGGYVVEELPEMQSGGSPSQVWYQYTGTPWSEARKKGLTDGSKEQNTELRKRILAGEFGEPKFSNEKYQNIKSNYDKNVEKMVAQGKTLDQLVKQKVGTRAGLKSRFPELFKTKSKLDDFVPKNYNSSNSSSSKNKNNKSRWGNVTVKSNDGKPIYRKDDYIDMVQSKDSKIKAEGLAMQAEHKEQLKLEKLIAKELKKPEHLQFTPDTYFIEGSFSNPYNPNNNIPISDNTNIYRQPMSVDWSLDPKYKNNLNLFLEKKRFEDLKAEIKADMDSKIKTGPVNYDGTVETVGQYNRRKKRYDDLDLLGKMIENDPADNYWFKPKNTSPFEDLPITGIGPTPKMILQAGKWLKPLWTGTKNATQPFRQATVSALKAPLPLGRTITNATAGTLTPRNLLFSYWAGESAYNQGDSNSDVRKSQSNLINNPSWNTLGDASFETGVNSLGFLGLGLGKQVIKPVYNASKNVINNTYKVLGKNTKFFNSGEKPHWFKGYKQEWDPMLADLEPLSDFRTIQSGKNKGARTIWNDVEKKYRKMYYELETQKNAALKSNNKKLASDIDNKIQDIFYARKKEFQEIHNKNFKSKKHPFKESLGSGRFSTVYGLPKSEFTVKVGTIPEGEDVFKLVKNAKNIKKSNIAVPKKTYTTSSGENVIVMNKVDPIEGSIFLNPPTKKSYEQLLKDTEELKNKGLYLDFQNHNNIVYNPSTGLFNIYDLNTTGYLFRNNRLGKTYDSSKKTIEQILIDTGKLPKDWKQLPTSNKTIAHLEASPNTMARLEKTNTNTTNYEENIFIPKSVVDNPTAKDLAKNLELINKTKKFEVIDDSLKAKIINFIKSSLIPINENLIVPLRYRSSIKKAKEFFNEQKEYFKIPEVKAKLIKYGINPDDLQKIKFKYGNSGSSAAEKSIQFDPKQLKKLQKLGIQVDEKSAIAHEYGHILGFNGKDAFLPNITSGNLPINKEIFKKVINGKVKYGSPEHFLKYYAKDINTNTPESFAHLREMKQNMINNGIINRLDEPVTERQIIEFFSHDYGKGTDRVSSFVDIGDPKLIKFLSKELSKVRVLAPIIGAGALSSKTVQQKQKGGLVNNYVDAELTLKEIKDLIAQGYVIEELN